MTSRIFESSTDASRGRRLGRVALALIVLVLGAPRASAEAPFPSGSASSAAAVPVPELPLSALPEPPRTDLPAPTKSQLAELDALLRQIASKDPAEREIARAALGSVNRELVPAIARRVDTIAEGSERRELGRLLDDIRKDARGTVRATMKASGARGSVDTPDYLEMLLSHPRLDWEAWTPLVQVVAMSRMLARIGTVEATRELIRVRVRFEFLRRDVQLLLDQLGDRALAATIEAQRHPARDVGRWATQRLDLTGKAIPSETVQTDDLDVLADVLRAYGKVRDPDAARLVISFANSERAQIRLAARQSVRLFGDVADWQLRDTYENIVGKKPPRDWSWERTARELFTEFDRLRLARVYEAFGQGLAAFEANRLDEAVEKFDKVLARSPIFEHADKMVLAYVAFARQHLDDAPERANQALGRARRLAGDELAQKPIESLELTLEGEQLLDRGIADPLTLRRALELDPTNARAQAVLDRIQRGDAQKESALQRYVAAGAIGFAALVAVLVILLWRRKPPDAKPAGGAT